MSLLRSLDDRVIPPVGRSLRRLILSTSTRTRAASASLARARGRAVAARGAALRRLDDRFATRGPLGLVRRAPQVGLLVAFSVLLAGGGVALAHPGDRTPAATAVPGVNALALLGPAPGVAVDQYVRQAQERLVAAEARSPGATRLALVSFSGYVTPQQAAAVLGPLQPVRAYLRAPGTGPAAEIVPVPLGDLLPDLRRAYGTLAVREAAAQREYRRLATSIKPTTPQNRQFKGFYLTAAQTAGKEAAAFRAGCACVFELVVRGPLRQLGQLPSVPGVRAVEVAGPSADSETVRVLPLLPETQAVVPEPPPGTGG